jgi:hypothetical protein
MLALALIGEIMKNIFFVTFLIVLSGCGKITQVKPVEPPKLIESKAINLFKAVCLDTAPSFNEAESASSENGIDILDGGFMKLGFNDDKSLGVQIQKGKECVVTAPSQNDNFLTSNFLMSVADYLGVKPAKRVPFVAKVNNEKFIFTHDRKGGEAFVMLKK